MKKFQEDMMSWYGNHYYPLEFEIRSLLETNPSLTLSEIKCLLKQSKIEYTDEMIEECLYNLLVRYGAIVKDDFWDGEPRYHYIEQYRQDSSYTKSYYSFNVDNNQNKKFLLTADTHIGNPEFENFRLVNNVYEKGIEMGANKCFHLGDIFDGRYLVYSDEEAEKQLEAFIKKYPNPDKSEMMTYALLGNHDEWIHGSVNHISKYGQAYYYDFRCLSKYIPSFNTFQRDKWQTSFGDIGTLFSHRLYISWIYPDKRLHQLEDIEEEKRWMNSDYRLLVSGHLHCGFLYSADDLKYSKDDIIFLGVPSTSNRNLGGTVAYVISMNYKNGLPQNMEITPLDCDRNCSIYEGETFEWNFRGKNKVYQKTFNIK